MLGDLNNFTSDFRAVEGSNLLAVDPAEIAATEKEMEKLDRSIAQAERNYEQIRHDAGEMRLYASFKEKWNDYRKVRQPDADSVAGKPQGRSDHHVFDEHAVCLQCGERCAGSTHRTDGGARPGSERSRRCRLSAGALADRSRGGARGSHGRRRAALHQPLDLGAAPASCRCMHRLAGNDTAIEIQGTGRRDEIGEMARAAVVFQRNAVELIRQTAMLEEKLAQEQRLAMLQRNFVSMASHEFRTPLSIIDGHAQRLIKLKDGLAPAEIAERAGKMRAAVLRLTHLIENLLDSSRLIDAENGILPASRRDRSRRAAARDLPVASRDSARITNRGAICNALNVMGDPKLLFQVFSNLLSNAIKYSASGEPVIDQRLAQRRTCPGRRQGQGNRHSRQGYRPAVRAILPREQCIGNRWDRRGLIPRQDGVEVPWRRNHR